MTETTISTCLSIEINDCIIQLCSSKKINQSQLLLSLDDSSDFYSAELVESIKKNDLSECKKILKTGYWKRESWKDLASLEGKRKEVKINQVANTSIVCKKCEKQTVNCVLVQKRSADEGMTQCFSCLNCGNAWQK